MKSVKYVALGEVQRSGYVALHNMIMHGINALIV